MDRYMPVYMAGCLQDGEKLVEPDLTDLYNELENIWVDYVDKCRRKKMSNQPRTNAFEIEVTSRRDELKRATWYRVVHDKLKELNLSIVGVVDLYPKTVEEVIKIKQDEADGKGKE